MSARWRFVFVPVLSLLLVWFCVFAVQVMVADVLNFNVQRAVVFWGVDGRKPTADELGEVRAKMDLALRFWPLHPDYLALQARLYAWQGQIATSRSLANAEFKLALTTMHKSLEQRPGNPYSWAQYAEYLSLQRDKSLELFIAADKVKVLGAGDAGLQKRVQALVEH